MNIGRNIVSEILRSGSIRAYLDAGMAKGWLHAKDGGSSSIFANDLDREAYDWLLDYWNKHKKTPDLEIFHLQFPEKSYRLNDNERTADELVDLAKREIHRLIVAVTADQMAELHDKDDIEQAVVVLNNASRTILTGIRAVGVTEEIGNPEEDVEEFMNQHIDMGVPMGFETVDEQYYGWQNGQLITFLGRQKSTKTTSLLYNAVAAWEAGFSVLFYSVEMAVEEIKNRLYAIGAGVNPEKIRRGTLHSSQKQKVRDFHGRLVEDFGDVRLMISKQNAMLTIDDIQSEVERENPHVVFIDGEYFMRDRITGDSAGSKWEANENVAAELKTLALEMAIPIVVTTQAQEKQHNKKKRGIEGGTIMGGTGLLKASDLVLGFDKNPDEPPVTLNCVLSRYAPVDTLRFQWDWDSMSIDFLDDDEDDEI